VRQALGHALDELPPAVDYVAKQEGAQALMKAVEKAFALHVRINWNLVFRPGDASSPNFLQMVNAIEGGLGGDQVISRASELEDLFRSLFYDMAQIRIGHMVWTREGRVALSVYAFAEQSVPQFFVVVCGERAHIQQEADRYHEFAPKAPGSNSTVIFKTAATTHFGANAYILAGADGESLCPLAELYRASADKTLYHALESLFQKTLLLWHRVVPTPAAPRNLGRIYCEGLGLSLECLREEQLERQLAALVRQAPALGVRVWFSPEALEFQFGDQSFAYPSPVPRLSSLCEADFPAVMVTTPGLLSGDSVLVDKGGLVWLTDLTGAGPTPQEWDFVAIEAAIRFD
jgi:hypothetical protein